MISLSDARFWNTYGTNKQYPTLVLSIGQESPQMSQYGVMSVLPSLFHCEIFQISRQG